MAHPHTKKELRKLLGDFGYYPDYIEHYAHIVKPLTDLTGKKVPNILPWEECHQQAYELLHSKLRSSHVVRIPRVGDPFVLHTDASGVAMGATLGQLDKDGVDHPLAFASHKLTGSQCIWSTIERAAYAIIWALDKFRNTVYGSNITVVCDYNLLQYIRDCALKGAKLLRWSLALQEFDLEINYK